MDLELGEMLSFITLADGLHFGRAAETLHVSQPALSKQIQRMEAKLGGPLLVRRYRKVSLTPAGVVLRERARQILRDAGSAEELVKLAIHGEAGLLRVGFGIASLASGLPELVLSFRKRYPHAHMTMRDMSTPAQIESLLRGEIDAGFVRLPVLDDRVAWTAVLDEHLVVAYNPRGDFRPTAGLSSLRGAPFVVHSRATSASLYDHIVRTCRAAGFEPRIVQEASELFTVLNLVRSGLGVSLVPSSARLMRVPQVRLSETRVEEAKWSVGIAWKKEEHIAPLVERFVELARDWYARLGPRPEASSGSTLSYGR
jgi:DNA-binding transcriptional LysR family regulator